MAFILAGLCMAAPYFIRRRAHAKRLARFEEQFPEALALLASTLRAGISLPMAVAKIAEETEEPLSEEFGMLRREIQLGRTEQGFRELSDRVPLESVRLFVTAVTTCLKLGGNLAEMSDSIADTIRRNIELRGELRALTAEGRLQGLMMAAMPFGVAGILALINPDLMEPLITHWIGNLIVGAVIVLELIGAIVINEMLKIED
ncbi:MAG: type II secretion system F family protein [Planctomycetota bacterium]|nr:type II secretion system F family protein [Planctomycetota bacterium]